MIRIFNQIRGDFFKEIDYNALTAQGELFVDQCRVQALFL